MKFKNDAKLSILKNKIIKIIKKNNIKKYMKIDFMKITKIT